MAKTALIGEPNLPWSDYAEDRNFRRFTIILLVVFMCTGLVLNLIKLPDVVQKNLVDVSPRLAKLILEKKKVKPPPKKIETKKVEKKKTEKKQDKKKPKKKTEKPKQKEKPKRAEKKAAREVAKQSGLIALADELADLRDSFDLDSSLALPQQTTGNKEVVVASAKELLGASAAKSSGGIKTDTLSRNLQTSELSQRKSTQVESKIGSGQQIAKTSGNQKKSSPGGIRSADEIERVFQKNKGGIFNIYNRALRKNPSLAGQVVIELTIAADGSVINAKILSSELGDAKLERKLLLKIKKFKFARSNVAQITVTYPIDFLPS